MHRDVYEYYYGEIPDGYDVHHKDGDRSNNDIGNLEIYTKSEHGKVTWKMKGKKQQ
ncbi:MAG: HNH endonuclease [Candidatus Omnitrophota bacterium]|nr:MAG: HNH endonuclease [Candidatus Omnitrophota bacterium]